MRTLVTCTYWIVAVLLLALTLTSFGYTFARALFVATAMLPGMLCAKFSLPRALAARQRRAVAVVSVAAAILLIEWTAMLLAYHYTQTVPWHDDIPFPAPFSNPLFLLILVVAFALPEELLARWIDRRWPRRRSITFISDRRRTTLDPAAIRYIVSNDSEVVLHTADGGSYRTKTRISQWEELLDDRFLRIHRSLIVNTDHITEATPTHVVLGDLRLEYSRKYRETALARLGDRIAAGRRD